MRTVQTSERDWNLLTVSVKNTDNGESQHVELQVGKDHTFTIGNSRVNVFVSAIEINLGDSSLNSAHLSISICNSE